MIGSLRGTLLHRSSKGELVLEVCGVGYRLTVSPSTVVAAGDVGDTVLLHTHLCVREDSLTLYGFASRGERDCFEVLIGAHGVGPALALAILSVHPPLDLRRAVAEGDRNALTLVPGVGAKTAERLLLELKSSLQVPDGAASTDHADAANGSDGSASSRAEVQAALSSLGYEADEVRGALKELPADGGVEQLLRDALRVLGGRR